MAAPPNSPTLQAYVAGHAPWPPFDCTGPFATTTQPLAVQLPCRVEGMQASAWLLTPSFETQPQRGGDFSGGGLAVSGPPYDWQQEAVAVADAPLVVFSPGFLVEPGAYHSYCEQLASWG